MAAGKPAEIQANNLMGTSGLAYAEAIRHEVQVPGEADGFEQHRPRHELL